MNTAPIPKEILIHSCTLRIYSRSGDLGKRRLISETALSDVRLALKTTVREDNGGRRLCPAGTLYYDCVNSRPEEVTFLENDCESIIVFRNEEYRIGEIRYIYGAESLHHLEIELGGKV